MRTRLLPVVLFCLLASGASGEPLREIKVLSDRAPDCSSLESIVATVTRNCKTDDARAVALYNFCRYAYYHHAYPTEPGGISALKLINVYGWGLCGGQHTVMAALWEKAGYRWRYRGWSNPGHTTVEVFYGGRWHYLDTFLKFYVWTDGQSPAGRTIASQEDIRANPALTGEAFQFDQDRKVWYFSDSAFGIVDGKANWTAPAFLVCGDTLDGVRSGVASSRDAGSPRGWGGIRFDDPDYSTAVNLRPGFALTLDWAKTDDAWYFRGSKQSPRHTCGDKDYRNCPAIGPLLEPYRESGPARSWSNGTLVFRPDFRTEASLDGFYQTENVVLRDGALHPKDADRAGVAIVEMASPYVVAKAAAEVDSGDATLEVSTDLKRWVESRPAELGRDVAGSYRYYVRITFRRALARLVLSSIVQHNQEALPYLAPGVNKIAVAAANGGQLNGGRLVVTYAYCPGWRDATPEEVCDRGAELARAHYAHWTPDPVVVQKTFDRLPGSMEILVPTPKGKQPVYPRMLFLRRELLAPGQMPAPVPAAPSTPTVASNETLATLPEPWTIGGEPPVARPDRPTTTTALPAVATSYVSKQGEVFDHQFVKWLKDDTDAWILLASFDPARLPKVEQLASARLLLYVHEAHDKAPMQVAAIELAEPFEAGKPYDFSKVGRTAGTTIVQQGSGPGAPFSPPRQYAIDVTRLVRQWIAGRRPAALAVRIVPNRSVDDGWTVRFTPERAKPVEMEISTYPAP